MENQMTELEAKPLIPGEFKHNDRVLGLRSLKADFTSYNGFVNPRNVGEEVFAPDWDAAPNCGNGLHFVPWGLGCDGQEGGMHRPVWQVVEPIGEVVTIGGKCKSPGLRVVHVGTLAECTAITVDGLNAFIAANSRGSASSTGDGSSASSTGYRGSASSTGDGSSASSTGYSGSASSTGYSGSASSTGDRGSASSTGDGSSASSTGYRGSASSTGDSGSASSTGDSGSASSTGYSGSASSTGYGSSASSTGYGSSASSTGYASVAVCTGLYAKAMAGAYGSIALATQLELSPGVYRREMHCARVGCGDGSDGLLKANTWYSVNEKGEFCEQK